VQLHNPYDNCGPHILGLDKDDITAQQELAAFDQLGPLTRRVIDEKMCVRWSSHKMLEVIKILWRSDPRNPTTDRSMADMLLTANAGILAQIRMMRL
jgi:hypothetical protein